MMKNFVLGQMRYEVTIQEATQQRDAAGAWTDVWADLRVTRAKREYRNTGSGEGYEDDLQKVGVQSVAYTIRKLDTEITTNRHRLKIGDDLYDIVQVQPSGYGERYILLICDLRNNE